jgi:hypothetical protein
VSRTSAVCRSTRPIFHPCFATYKRHRRCSLQYAVGDCVAQPERSMKRRKRSMATVARSRCPARPEPRSHFR